MSVALVVLVVFLFLREYRATLIPLIAVPTSIIGTLAAMYPARLQHRQSVAHGADDLHRDSWSTTPSWCSRTSRAIRKWAWKPRQAAMRGRGGNRLDRAVHERVAGGGVHPHPADGRHHRPVVPRIRGGALDRDPGVARRLAHHHADDVLRAAARESGARQVVPGEREGLRPAAQGLRAQPALGARSTRSSC